MQNTQDFLVEIGTEELPPREIELLASQLDLALKNLLNEKKIAHDGSTESFFGSPRRIAVVIKNVATKQEQQVIARQGPAVAAAYNADGTPTQAALGFAKSCGIDIAQVTKIDTDKGQKLYFEETVPGKNTIELLPEIVESALKKLPIKKYMRWGVGDVAFVRPVHWIVMLFGKEVVNAQIFAVQTGSTSYGHRVLSDKAINITSPDTYETALEKHGNIIPHFAKRKANILDQIAKIEKEVHGIAVKDEALLNTVTGLVEHPAALVATFDPAFLRVPKECLISAMQDHQKCFALLDKDGNMLPKFILISNLTSTDPQTIIRGNELVMNARLADAAFYFDKDQQQTLETRREQLKSVVYVKKLGSIYDKTERIKKLAAMIAKEYFANTDLAHTQRAAELCKADLLTNMVYEFPELQGIMGCYYAKHDKENLDVANAIQEHYQPRFAEDKLPESAIGTILALADRIDTIVGMFGIGNFPTGEKDPYALRRQGIATLRIILEKPVNLDLKALINFASANFKDVQAPSAEYYAFFSDRLKALYLAAGIHPKTIAAVMATISHDPATAEYRPADIDQRIKAVQHFQSLAAAESLAAANKRVHNLLEKSAQNNGTTNVNIVKELLIAAEEQALYKAIQDKENEIAPLLLQQNYTAVLQALSTLQEPVDAFFNNVMVMDEDLAKRNNRLNLLQKLRGLFLTVADISLL